MSIFHGNIFRWGGTELSPIQGGDLDAKWMSELTRAAEVETVARYQVGEKRSPWHRMKFVSHDPITPLHKILRAENRSAGPFRYEILYRVNELTGTIVLLATSRLVVGHLVSKTLANLNPKLITRQINVAGLAKHLLEQGYNDYAMTTVRARFVPDGQDLEKMDFDGNDLANSETFRGLFRFLTPTYLGLRDRRDGLEVESIRLSNRGYLAVSLGERFSTSFDEFRDDRQSATQEGPEEFFVGRAEDCLRYLNENDFYL